jgi:hypothetical protein
MTPFELAGLKTLHIQLDAMRTQLDTMRAQLDGMIAAAEPKVDAEVQAKVELDAKADKYIMHWKNTTGSIVPHNLMRGWIKDHGINTVIGAMNAMFIKREKTEMDERYQINYVAKVLKANATEPCNAGGIQI